ncbi:DUF418 domain-containing protein [Rhodocytophaga rosea]|uniref:DUF418 domain-containing protein n=1 Tax=Rhodocytophaga rosea TaxID=2704465 RepID=A0A6C0GDK3_9BACT|nr:DUF418 domain-containing protein [Rhodocytophaga rosea]QHT66045.1 DUF418 domain-containing protein [Rhodocytophaga rosea]
MTAQTLTLSASPVRTVKERIQVLDVLRGFALFGILLAHLSNEFAAGPLPNEVYQSGSVIDNIANAISGILVQGKFYAIFSFLFGLSFALQLEQAKSKGGNFFGRYAWRLVILGIIGTIHHLHWRGDILTIYVILGFVMLLFHNISTKVLLIVAVLLILNTPGRITEIYRAVTAKPDSAAAQQQKPDETTARQYYDVITKGSYSENLIANFYGFKDKAEFQVMSGRIYMTLGYFLMGLYMGRRKLFEKLAQHKLFFKKLFKYCGFATLGLIGIAIIIFAAVMPLLQLQDNPYMNIMGGGLYDSANAALTFFYIAGVTLLFTNPVWTNKLSLLAPVGKMALTNYLLQTAIGLLLFQGYGLGLFFKMGVAAATALTIPIFIAQVLFSKWWLSRFQYGPVEWLWRFLTYFKLPPMTRNQIVA